MNDQLYVWLQNEWIECNHEKYQHYFKKWVDNIVESQIKHFDRMRISGNVYEKTN